MGKKKLAKNKWQKKYAIKRGESSILRESTATYSTLSLQATPKKVLAHINETPYFHKDNFVLYNADCLKILEQLPENSIDMIFADPPYFLSSGSFTCQNGKMVSVKKGDWDLSNGTKNNFEFHLG